jgi:hypothetical protein
MNSGLSSSQRVFLLMLPFSCDVCGKASHDKSCLGPLLLTSAAGLTGSFELWPLFMTRRVAIDGDSHRPKDLANDYEGPTLRAKWTVKKKRGGERASELFWRPMGASGLAGRFRLRPSLLMYGEALCSRRTSSVRLAPPSTLYLQQAILPLRSKHPPRPTLATVIQLREQPLFPQHGRRKNPPSKLAPSPPPSVIILLTLPYYSANALSPSRPQHPHACGSREADRHAIRWQTGYGFFNRCYNFWAQGSRQGLWQQG